MSDFDPRPCKGENVNICVGEGCYGESCRGIFNEAITRADERAKHGERIAAAIEQAASQYRAEDEADKCTSRFCDGWLLGQAYAADIATSTGADS